MKLYHFAPEHMVEGILHEGLTKGTIPMQDDERISFFGPCQWLTADKDFNAQSWATSKLIDYDRTAVRLQISIPKSHRHKLKSALEMERVLPIQGLVTGWPGSENWYVFLGSIPRGWIRQVAKKPEVVAYELA